MENSKLSLEQIERDKKLMQEFETAAKPLIEFYKEKLNPLMDIIVIDFGTAKIVRPEYSFPIREGTPEIDGTSC